MRLTRFARFFILEDNNNIITKIWLLCYYVILSLIYYASITASGAIFLIKPWSTLPGPSSRNDDAPSATIF